MKPKFSQQWNASTQPRRQRKLRANAPLHVKGKFLSANLAKSLREKQGTRTARIRVGDRVKVLRGQFKGREGKIEDVNVAKEQVVVAGVQISKTDGTKARYPLKPSNVQIIELETGDARRFKTVEAKKTETKVSTPSQPKTEAKKK